MIDDNKIIEKGKQSLSFVEQLQNQIQLCREALSDNSLPLTPKVHALETLLWAKIKDDIEYKKTMEKLNEWFEEKTKDLKNSYQESTLRYSYMRGKAREQFKAIMIFIDKKGYMPIGEDNE